MLIQLKMEKEIRCIDSVNAEIRLVKRTRKIEGYGIVFNKESKDLGGFKEIITPDAVTGVLEESDVLALLNHDESKGVLARSTNGEGTLDLTIDKTGVKYSFEAPDTVLGDELLSGVRRGDIRTSSFAFSVSADGQKWEKRKDDTYLRTITKFDAIYDVSPVYREAYADTTVAVRNLSTIKTKDMGKTEIPGEEKRTVMDITKMRKETLKDGTVILYEDWLSRGTQVFVEKDGVIEPAPDGIMTVREREEVYTSNMAMTLKDGFVTEIKSSNTSVTRKEPEVKPEDLTEYFNNLRNLIPKK
jgi:HK97 family phage prohead protease